MSVSRRIGTRRHSLAGAVLLLGAVLVVSGCEQGPGTPQSKPLEHTPAPTKTKPALQRDLWRASHQANDVASGDDHGNRWTAATEITAGSSTPGTLTAGDIDYFEVTVSEPGLLSATTTGHADTIGWIGAPTDERTLVAFDFDDDSGDGYNFGVSASVNAGTYYIGVAGYDGSVSGNYTLLVSFREGRADAGDDHGDWRLTATRITAGSSTPGILTAGDVDFFAIKILEPGTLSAGTTGNTDTFGVLHDSVRALGADDDGGVDYNFWVSAPVSAGTHYIEVKGYSDWTAGEYTLQVNFSPDSGKPQPSTGRGVDTVVESVGVGDVVAVLRHESWPAASGGPGIQVSGNSTVISGGTFFLDVEPDPGAALDKLLLTFAGDSFGYYEIELPEVASSYRVVGQIAHDIDAAAMPSFGLSIVAVGADQAVGQSVDHGFDVIEVGVGDVQVSLSWDVDSDVDLHVVDPNGDEIFYNRKSVASGGKLDLDSNPGCNIDGIRNENITWPQGSAPEGLYTVRVNYYRSCGVAATNYVVSVNNGGQISRFSGVLIGGGQGGGLGSGEVVTTFVHGAPTPPPEEEDASCTYRGSGDQVCSVPYSAESIDYTISLGRARPDVYVIATNTTTGNMNPRIVTRAASEAAAKGLRPMTDTEHVPHPEPVLAAVGDGRYGVPGKPSWVAELNANPPPRLPAGPRGVAPQAQPAVTVGDRFTFQTYDEALQVVDIPATARSVITAGTITLAVWVADDQWGSVLSQTMADAIANRFLRPGGSNDIYDWLTAIFGDPWGPHRFRNLIPQQAANRIHILLFDIDDDGYGGTVGYFAASNNFLRDSNDSVSSERLMFYLDAPSLAQPDGPSWEITDAAPSDMVDTLAHEFQHMIHFYQKGVLHNVDSEPWLNEMASEVASDLIADKMMANGPRGVAYGDPTAGAAGTTSGRLPLYNAMNDIQVTTWDNADSYKHYAITYALGAYLARNYGGAALFRAIVQNNGTGTDAVEAALRTLGNSVSFGDLIVNWAVANLLSDDTGAPAPYRYNAGTWSTSSVGAATYRVGSINLFNYRYGSLSGPRFSSLAGLSRRTQPPHSNT